MTPAGPPSVDEHVADLAGISHENRVLRELVAIYHHLTGLALQSADLRTVTSLLADKTGASVTVVDLTLDVLAAAHSGQAGNGPGRLARVMSSQRLGRVLRTAAQTRRPLRLPVADDVPALVVAPILVGNDVVAYLLAEEAAAGTIGGDLSLLVTEHAATICGVVLGRERVVAAAAGRVRDDLVEGLLLGRARSPDEPQRWARHLGYDSTHLHRVLSVVPEEGSFGYGPGSPAESEPGEEAVARRRRVFASIEHLVLSRAPHAIVASRDQEMVLVAREDSHGTVGSLAARQLAADCLAHSRRLFPDVVLTVGIGGSCREPAEIAKAYAQARRAIETARRLGRQGEAIAFEDLGIHRLLFQVPDLGELRAYAEEVLGPLHTHERRYRTGYLPTLAAYFRENGSLQRAARQLHVHPNTVTYRLNRVEEITGLDLSRYQDRLTAQVALEILEALEDRR